MSRTFCIFRQFANSRDLHPEILVNLVHVVPNGARRNRAACLAVSANKAVLAEPNVVINEMDLFDVALRGLGYGTLYRLI